MSINSASASPGVCIAVCLHDCMSAFLGVCISVCLHDCIYVRVSVNVFSCMTVCVCPHVCLTACLGNTTHCGMGLIMKV